MRKSLFRPLAENHFLHEKARKTPNNSRSGLQSYMSTKVQYWMRKKQRFIQGVPNGLTDNFTVLYIDKE